LYSIRENWENDFGFLENFLENFFGFSNFWLPIQEITQAPREVGPARLEV